MYHARIAPPGTHDHMNRISILSTHNTCGKDSLGRLLSRTNLDWHDVSASHSRSLIRLRSGAVCQPSGSRAGIWTSVPRLPPPSQHQVHISHGGGGYCMLVVDDPLHSRAEV